MEMGRLTRTEVIEYDVNNSDQTWYTEEDADTIEKKVLADREGISEELFDMKDIDIRIGGAVPEVTVTAEIFDTETGDTWTLDEKGTRHPKHDPELGRALGEHVHMTN